MNRSEVANSKVLSAAGRHAQRSALLFHDETQHLEDHPGSENLHSDDSAAHPNPVISGDMLMVCIMAEC